MKKGLCLLIIIVLLMGVLVACGGSTASPLVGTWETTHGMQRGVALRHVFESNGNGREEFWNIGGDLRSSSNFNWTSDDGVITFIFDDGGSRMRTYSISDGRLTTVAHSPLLGEHDRQVWTRQ